MYKQLPDKTDGDNGTAVQPIHVLTMAPWEPDI